MLLVFAGGLLFAQQNTEHVVVNVAGPTTPFPHFWEQIFGSGRAILSLRDSYRLDLRSVKKITDLQYIRFHAILHDEVGIYDEDSEGKPTYNFSYLDQIYDGLLANGVRPFVELSFMPQKLAAKNSLQAFWYRPNVSPPKDWAKWDALIESLVTHLVNRYGADEVAQWYFEVWNEPNIDFWAGDPRQATYFELYDHTVLVIKRVNPRIRVGGPATAQAAWVDAFLKHCEEKNIPVDFVSSHVYGNDKAQDVFGTSEVIPREKMVCRAVGKVHRQIQASSLPHLPLIWTEFNASYKNEREIEDSIYMGPWLADTIRQCDGLVDEMSYWTFSDVFEEQGVVKQPFYGGFGVIAADGLPKPSFNAFRILHMLGDQRLAVNSDSVLATRRKDGSIVVAAWNLVPADQSDQPQTEQPKTIAFRFEGLANERQALVWRVDHQHGDVTEAYKKMSSPRYPTKAQIEALSAAAQLQNPEQMTFKDKIELTLPADGLAVVEIRPATAHAN